MQRGTKGLENVSERARKKLEHLCFSGSTVRFCNRIGKTVSDQSSSAPQFFTVAQVVRLALIHKKLLIVCRPIGIIREKYSVDVSLRIMTKRNSSLRDLLASNIRTYRKAKGLSQEALADKCSLHRTYVGSVERSERNVTLSTLETLAEALGISVIDLLSASKESNGK